jgi:hypothetical protein
MENRAVKPPRVGLALAGGHGWWQGETDEARFEFDAHALAAGDAASLAYPLRAARRKWHPTSTARIQLHVALCTPWTAPREVTLPPLRRHEAMAVLTRDLARHTAVLRSNPCVAVRSLRRDCWLVADADAAVLDAITREAFAAGYTAVRIAPAVDAWTHAVRDGIAHAFVVDGEATVLTAQAGRLATMRRCRAEDAPAGATVVRDALALAARHSPQAAELEWVGPLAAAARLARVRHITTRLLAGGLAALLLASALVPWGSARRLARIESTRDSLATSVRPLSDAYAEFLAVESAREALASARAHVPWTVHLAALASALPDGAHFSAVRADGDSVMLEGSASDARRALTQLAAARGVRHLRALAAGAASDDGQESFAAVVHFNAGRRR